MVRTAVGYTGGESASPVYLRMRDHSEAVLVEFDPDRVSYRELLDLFWESHKPTEGEYSRQYRNAIFYLTAAQQKVATESMLAVQEKSRYPVTTKIEAAGTFYPAEDYHQKYYLRKRSEILGELQQAYPGESFVSSLEAARINGYLGCYGKKEEIEMRLPQLGLSPEMQNRLVKYVSTNCGRLAGLTCSAPAK